jgi:hypothetical protein
MVGNGDTLDSRRRWFVVIARDERHDQLSESELPARLSIRDSFPKVDSSANTHFEVYELDGHSPGLDHHVDWRMRIRQRGLAPG